MIITFGLLVACNTPSPKKVENEAMEIILKSVDKSGGMESWNSIDTLSFHKKSVLYLKDSAIESSSEQYQEFVFKPFFQVSLVWRDQSNKKTVYDGRYTTSYVGEEQLDRVEGMSASIASAFYVISKPFNLIWDKELLSYEGLRVLSGDTLHTVKVNYAHSNPSQDTWWYYINTDYSYWGSKVFHAPTYALIENTEVDISTGFTFPSYRRSYRIDSLNNIEFLRAEFWYSDYAIK